MQGLPVVLVGEGEIPGGGLRAVGAGYQLVQITPERTSSNRPTSWLNS
jgi:hypothetical protein